MLEFETKTIANLAVINITGTIDSSNFQGFQAYLEEQIKQGAQKILLNFQSVKHISSAGLRVVHNIFNNLRSLHKDVDDDELRKRMSAGAYKSPYLKICCLAPQVASVFSMGGFDIYIESFTSEAEAINSFNQ